MTNKDKWIGDNPLDDKFVAVTIADSVGVEGCPLDCPAMVDCQRYIEAHKDTEGFNVWPRNPQCISIIESWLKKEAT